MFVCMCLHPFSHEWALLRKRVQFKCCVVTGVPTKPSYPGVPGEQVGRDEKRKQRRGRAEHEGADREVGAGSSLADRLTDRQKSEWSKRKSSSCTFNPHPQSAVL